MLIADGGPAGMMLRIRSPAQEYTWSAAAAVASGSGATSKFPAAAPKSPPPSPAAKGVVFTDQVDGLSPYAANLCPFYLGAADGDLRPRRAILHNVGRPCKWFWSEVVTESWRAPRLGSKGTRSKGDSKRKEKWGASVGLSLILRSISSDKNISRL